MNLLRYVCYRISTKIDGRVYNVLELKKGASEEEIKSAYYRLAKQYHPDVNPKYADKFK